jgi:sortase (surface protein transpeptidase)
LDFPVHRATNRINANAERDNGTVRLRIPSIDVDTGLEALERASDQNIEVPRQPSSAGWWAGGSRPGQVRPAVILGPVNSKTGPTVFSRLDELNAGDEVLVDHADRTVSASS